MTRNLYWGHMYDAKSTDVLYTAADKGNTTALQTLRARDARASLLCTYGLVVEGIKRGYTASTFVDAMARQVGVAVNQMEMRDAHAGEYARQHVVYAYRNGGLASVLDTVIHYGKRAEGLANVRPETVAALKAKFCA